tara:strand:+ start:588 stop:845 length:258 start_codon:yes stop_codon:yes gene_type:complete
MKNRLPEQKTFIVNISNIVTMDFTQEVVDDSEYLGRAPANGSAYYNRMLDFSFIVYNTEFKVFHTRVMKGKFASCFEVKETYVFA